MGDATSISYLVVQTRFVVIVRASFSLVWASLVPVVGTHATQIDVCNLEGRTFQ